MQWMVISLARVVLIFSENLQLPSKDRTSVGKCCFDSGSGKKGSQMSITKWV